MSAPFQVQQLQQQAPPLQASTVQRSPMKRAVTASSGTNGSRAPTAAEAKDDYRQLKRRFKFLVYVSISSLQ